MSKQANACKLKDELNKSFNDLIDTIHSFVIQPERKPVTLKKRMPTS